MTQWTAPNATCPNVQGSAVPCDGPIPTGDIAASDSVRNPAEGEADA